jgi:uncharacterized protein (TIGR02996 family)
MTEESFLEGIVSSPADSSHRLVYADWLEERGDPRGAYLRAEVDWVTRRARGRLAKLRKLAEGLDPVWVARVSRPPAGVCCDRVTFTEPGPQLTQAALDEVEKDLGVELPPEFRAFYLNWNGGRPEPAYIPDPRPDRADLPLSIDRFLAAGKLVGELRFLHSLAEYLQGGPEDNPLLRDLVVFAGTPDDLGHFFVGVGGPRFGRVFHFTDYCHNLGDPGHLRDMAPSFGAILDMIGPEKQGQE